VGFVAKWDDGWLANLEKWMAKSEGWVAKLEGGMAKFVAHCLSRQALWVRIQSLPDILKNHKWTT
jgi:hypothetical protein